MRRRAPSIAAFIRERLKPGADTAAIDRRIEAAFGERWCIVFTDMSGFSRRAHRGGIIPFLTLIHQLGRICRPVIRRHGGRLLKVIADSYMILFRDPREALAACIEMQQAIHRYNDQAVEADHLYMGCGIGYGSCLRIAGDIFGVEVNFAAKLGEDLSGPYQVLLTPDALAAAGRVKGVRFRKVPGGRLGGTRLPYYEALYRDPGTTVRRKAGRARLRFR